MILPWMKLETIYETRGWFPIRSGFFHHFVQREKVSGHRSHSS